jgi:Ni,Fe-hydrogenase III large subunit
VSAFPLTLRNGTAVSWDSLPCLELDRWRTWILETCSRLASPDIAPDAAPIRRTGASEPPLSVRRGAPWSGLDGRIVALWAWPESEGFRLYALLAVDSQQALQIACARLPSQARAYASLTPQLPEVHYFERELHELHGIRPDGHPWLKALRQIEGIPFFQIEGDSIHEVAVGPVHAGVIEPGHFRFQCHGERVHHLEIQLGYQHRGVEGQIPTATPRQQMILAESIAGDTVIGHGWAYSRVMEGLSGHDISPQVERVRALALELERLANHVGDLGALATDVGFLPASAYFGRLRGEFLNLLLKLSGNRYGRGLLVPGGLNRAFGLAQIESLQNRLAIIHQQVESTADLLFSSSSVMTRFEYCGPVSSESAQALGLVGPVARACHLARDVRAHHPWGVYSTLPFTIQISRGGDVLARARVRWLEVQQSFKLVAELLESPGLAVVRSDALKSLQPSEFCVSMVEGWRGETVHIAATDEQANLCHFKIVDPSFHNWMGLTMALRGCQISDFPLNNKSFNLSYAGHDL